MTIRAALDALVTLEASLTISSPISASILHAYKYPPDRKVALEAPAWINTWSVGKVESMPNQVLRQWPTVTMQLFVRDANLDRACDIATAFWDAWVIAWAQSRSLGGVVDTTEMRGGTPTLGMLEWEAGGGPSYVGLTVFLDIRLSAAQTFSR